MTSLISSTVKTENTATIVVTEAIGDTLCIASEDGQKVYEQIEAAFNAGQKVILSFKGVEETTPAFMDTSIGQLYKLKSEEQIQSSLRVVDITPEMADDIENAVYWTKEYLKAPQRFKEAAQELLGNEDD